MESENHIEYTGWGPCIHTEEQRLEVSRWLEEVIPKRLRDQKPTGAGMFCGIECCSGSGYGSTYNNSQVCMGRIFGQDGSLPAPIKVPKVTVWPYGYSAPMKIPKVVLWPYGYPTPIPLYTCTPLQGGGVVYRLTLTVAPTP